MDIKGINKSHRLQWLIVGLVICLAFIWASTGTASAQSQPGSQAGQKKDFMWSVKTAKATVYLLGSFHLLKGEAYPLDRNIETAYRDCDRIIFEADIDGLNAPEFQSRMMSLGLYPEGQTLAQNISKETSALLEKKLAEVGLSMAQVSRFRPWFCALTLVVLELKQMGFDPTYGLDRYFFKKAQKEGKVMLFLETLDFQISLFSELVVADEEAFLRQTLKDIEVIEKMLPAMLSAWQAGDAARFEADVLASFKEYPGMYDRFLAQRNKQWAGFIEQLLAQGGTTLVVVGAAHLVGPDNLVQLLKNKGYAIEQVAVYTETAAMPIEAPVTTPSLGSEIEEQARALSLAMQSGLEQARTKDNRIQQLPTDLYTKIRGLLAEAFEPARLDTIVLGRMKAHLSREEAVQVRAWLDTPLGKRCADLFAAAIKPYSSAEEQEFMAIAKKSPVPPARMKLIKGLAAATNIKDIMLEIAVNKELVVTTVISTTFTPAGKWPFSKILDEAEKNRLLFEPRLDEPITALLLSMYSSLSDDELRQYLAFVESAAGARYYRALFNGMKLALMEAGIRFGAAMADLQWERKQIAAAP